jgi:hypothetical protein
MTKLRLRTLQIVLSLSLLTVSPQARSDFWGGDLVYLAQILQQAILQVEQLRLILGNGRDSLGYLQEINQGLRDALRLAETVNRTLKPGALSNLQGVTDVIRELEGIYGKIPVTSEAKLQSTHDLSVAESVHLHNEAFRYADQVDPEAERMKEYAQVASPQGAAKASLQAQGVQIHVLNQILRTNAALLKIQSENLALENRKAKLQSEQFRLQYSELSRSFKDFKPGFSLPSLSASP